MYLILALLTRRHDYPASGEALIELMLADRVDVAPFDRRHADIAALARDRYGKGNGSGGTLDFGDLLVYAVARDRGDPLLCAGNDFSATDLALHPASRLVA